MSKLDLEKVLELWLSKINLIFLKKIVRKFGFFDDWGVGVDCELEMIKFVYYCGGDIGELLNDVDKYYLSEIDNFKKVLFLFGDVGYVHECGSFDNDDIVSCLNINDHNLDSFAIKIGFNEHLKMVGKIFKFGFLRFGDYVEFIVKLIFMLFDEECARNIDEEILFKFVQKCCEMLGNVELEDEFKVKLERRLNICELFLK